MNGLGLPAAEPTIAELRAQLAVATACEPISIELQEAKAAYRDALDDGNPKTVAAAKERKSVAADHINETRTWLRREARIGRLLAEIPQLEARLAGQVLDEHGGEDVELRAQLEAQLAAMREELPLLEEEAAPLRELFAAAGPHTLVGDASVTTVGLPTVAVKAKPMKGGK